VKLHEIDPPDVARRVVDRKAKILDGLGADASDPDPTGALYRAGVIVARYAREGRPVDDVTRALIDVMYVTGHAETHTTTGLPRDVVSLAVRVAKIRLEIAAWLELDEHAPQGNVDSLTTSDVSCLTGLSTRAVRYLGRERGAGLERSPGGGWAIRSVVRLCRLRGVPGFANPSENAPNEYTRH
jgi:hypothetical protein